MEPVDLLSSLNKISLIAFLITLGFIIYQFYVFKKEVAKKKSKPNIPAFKENIAVTGHYTKVIVKDSAVVSLKKPSRKPLIIGIFIILIFAIVIAAGLATNRIPNTFSEPQPLPTPLIDLVASKGIKIFSKNWTPLSDNQIASLSAGQAIYIGVESISATDIDRARIRINENQWQTDNVTLNLKKEYNVYYREYTISSKAAALKIDAQLHSVADGWLGD